MIKLICGDCFKLLPKIADNSVDLILTDAPYLISERGSDWSNSPDKTEYIATYKKYITDFGDWDKTRFDLQTLVNECYRILKPSGTFIMWYDIWKFQELRACAEVANFKQPRIGCWTKTNPVPVNSKINYLNNAREYFATFVKVGNPTFNSEYDLADYFAESVFYQPILHGLERTAHPTQKPLSIIETLIRKHSNKNDLVLDMFAGSGTTPDACKRLSRNCIAIEKSSEYFKIMQNRVNNSIRKKLF